MTTSVSEEIAAMQAASSKSCKRLSRGCTKAERIEAHREKMKMKRERQLTASPPDPYAPPKRVESKVWKNKSIWPENKVAKPGRMA